MKKILISSVLFTAAFGLNMAAGVNETGLCENALWFDGQIQHLSPASFAFDKSVFTIDKS